MKHSLKAKLVLGLAIFMMAVSSLACGGGGIDTTGIDGAAKNIAGSVEQGMKNIGTAAQDAKSGFAVLGETLDNLGK